MKTNRYLLGLFLLVAGTMPAFSQVSNDNEDEVYKIDARAGRNDFVPGQVLVKFKDDSPVNVSNSRGLFRAASISAVDKVLKEFGVDTMDKLLPNEKPKPVGARRRSKAFNGQVVEEKDLSQIYLVKTTSLRKDSTMMLVNKLKELEEVEYAEPNYKVYIMGQAPFSPVQQQYSKQGVRVKAYTTETTDDVICADPSKNPLYSEQWGLVYEGLPELWKKPIINKKRPVIAILDTGVDIAHPDLVDNIWTNLRETEGEANYDNDGNGFKGDAHGWDFINNTADIRDYNSHGTHVAGIAAASNNETGIVGANPQALIMPITVMQSDGTGDAATIARGIDYAVENGATIINMSFGSYANSQTMRFALEKAYQSAILVAAAGNDRAAIYDECEPTPGSMFPAAYEFVLGTQAVVPSGVLAGFSNYDCDGPTFSLSGKDAFSHDEGGVNYEMNAPGVNIVSTIPSGNYKKLNGTSMAAPLLAGGISALMMVKDFGTQEILWGDIIHSTDLLKAYNVSERPAMLELVSFEWDDSQDGGNGDGMPDVGETLRLFPKIKTTWGEAKNILLNLSVGEFDDASLVDIQSKDVDFGWTLSNYAKETSKNPIIIKIGDNVADSRHIRLVLTVTCADSQQDLTYEFPIVVNNIVKIGGLISSDITLTADKNYLVTSNLAIPEGVTFTIEPGTTLRIEEGVNISNNGILNMKGTPEKPIILKSYDALKYWGNIVGKHENVYHSTDVIEYCILENPILDRPHPVMKNCVISNDGSYHFSNHANASYYCCNIINSTAVFNGPKEMFHLCNIVNNNNHACVNHEFPEVSQFIDCNYFNYPNYASWKYGEYANNNFLFMNNSSTPGIYTPEITSYLGTSRIDIAETYILDIDYNEGYQQVDLNNLRKEPVKEAHGIVWKVVVNGKDAQDEYEELNPLGVGKHKFEVYFNRPMNKEKVPQISFGVREPYTQNAVTEDGSWNTDGTIYTAYVTITGKTQSDGVNRIYVYGAEDDEFFECPYEKTRFNVNVQSAGSMATGFAAEAGLGRVNLTWNNDNNDFEDAMGFNIYRYTIDNEGKADTVCINTEIVDIETTEYSDYDVTPGTTYYYLYRVLSTDLKEYDVSNVVAATPLTSTHGDANGSGEVDVADVISTVNYAAGMNPKPFLFEAADMNTDNVIDILDVVGIIQVILNQAAPALAMVEATAMYTVEDGVLYVESPVALAGVQIQLNMSEKKDIMVTDALNGFEQVSTWLSDNDYLFMAYNMNGKTLTAGKHALLKIGDADLSNIRLSDAQGHNVMVIVGDGSTNIDVLGSKVQLQGGVFNLKGQKVAGKADDLKKLPKGVYIINGEKVIK